jgi:hypothetical protein
MDDAGGGGCRHLANAQDVLERSLCLDSTESRTIAGLGERCGDQIGLLEHFAEERSLWLPVEVVANLRPGGQEHDYLIVGDPEPVWIRRVTKDGTGFYPQSRPVLHLAPGTPHQYFTRLVLMGQMFPRLRYWLDGFTKLNGQFTIVTSQRFIPGRLLSDEAGDHDPKRPVRLIERWFERRGYQKLYLDNTLGPSRAWYHREENIAVFDAKPQNFLIWEDALFPVDVIPVQPTGLLLKKILAAL